MAETPQFKVGQTLYVRPSHSHPYVSEVKKVGRIWIYVGERYRFDPNKGFGSPPYWQLDGTSSLVYLSKEDYESAMALGVAWIEVRNLVYRKYNRPEGVTLEAMDQALRLLKLKE